MLSVCLSFAFIQYLNAQTPREEYPRPQFERAEWVNLNGKWSYSFDFGRTGREKGWQNSAGFNGSITVPFCPESRFPA